MFNDRLINELRSETPGCEQYCHFNNAGSSLMPAPVIAAIKDHIDLEAGIGGYEAYAATEDKVADAYSEAAKFLNCKPGNIAFVSNATDAFARALSSISFTKGDVLLTSEDDYISNQIMFLSLQKKLGINLVRVPCLPEGGIDVMAADEMIRKYHPKIVAVTQVPTNSGLVQDVKTIGEICERNDTPFLLDACQSVGQLPVDVKELRCDFLSATMRKFLRGPRGVGFLYVSDKALDKGYEPLFIDMQGAEWIEPNRYQPVDNAHRFEDWEFAYALVHGSREAFKYANRFDIEEVSARVNMMASGLREKISQLDGFEILDQGAQKCAIVTCRVDEDDYQVLKTHLSKHKINAGASLRHFATIDFNKKNVNWALRLAPHYFNTPEEIDHVVDTLSEFKK